MSAYSTYDYEFSFAERTIKNLELVQQIVADERAVGKGDKDITKAYEVTQLINSFVGLLIIPRQKCFKYMPEDIAFPRGSAAEDLFNKIKSDSNMCEDTYLKKIMLNGKWTKTSEIEEITPKILALRLRNAVSHDNLIIKPLSPGVEGVISGIEFLDKPHGKRGTNTEYFRLVLTVDETEILVKALSQLLLSCYPKKYDKF